jgi:serine/threonine protein kinase
MPTTSHILTIFGQALECDSPGDLERFLDGACQDDRDLRRRVEALLQAHEAAGSFLQGESPPKSGLNPPPMIEAPGTQIGPYKLLQQLGEGGMGTVWMAEQEEPVRRQVALKVIRPGSDSRQVLARFEAERQALAMMDHPNIAKVLDAGTVGMRNGECGVRNEEQGTGVRSQRSEIRDQPEDGDQQRASAPFGQIPNPKSQIVRSSSWSSSRACRSRSTATRVA